MNAISTDARVIDDGRTYEGISGVKSFPRMAGSEYTCTRTLVAVEEIAPDRWHVTNHLEVRPSTSVNFISTAKPIR